MITSGKVWEVLVNSVHLDFLQHLQESWLIHRVGCASPGTQPARSLHSSLRVLVILCPFCLWNAPLPVVQLRTGPEPSQHSSPPLCIWNKCNCEGSILKAARHMIPPTWLWCSTTQPSATVPSWSVGQVPAPPVSSLYAQLADIGLCCWQLNCWLIPTCQKDWIKWLQKVLTNNMNLESLGETSYCFEMPCKARPDQGSSEQQGMTMVIWSLGKLLLGLFLFQTFSEASLKSSWVLSKQNCLNCHKPWLSHTLSFHYRCCRKGLRESRSC